MRTALRIGRSADGKLQVLNPQLVMLDIQLQGMQGGDILAIQLKKHPKLQRARIIFHSAAKVADLQVMVRRAGADGFIVKGDDDVLFLEAIAKFLDPRGTQGARPR